VSDYDVPTRLIREYVPIGMNHAFNSPGNPATSQYYGVVRKETGKLYSRGHKRDKDGVYRGGGWFVSIKRGFDTEHGTHATHYGSSPTGLIYKGGYVALENTADSLINAWHGPIADISTARDAVQARGAEAYNALRPDLPDFNIVTSLAELREVPGGLLGPVRKMRNNVRREQHRKHQQSGNPYWLQDAAEREIARRFGWQPLLHDVHNFMVAFVGRTKRFEQLLRDNDRYIYRRRNLSGSVTVHGDGNTHYT
jgi:hypothetical protein